MGGSLNENTPNLQIRKPENASFSGFLYVIRVIGVIRGW